MNLDDLISKYLDGELSEEEDANLRDKLSQDLTAKEEFDEAVHIHMAFREDADSIEPPKDFIRETEEKVLMKILSRQPVSTDTAYVMPAKRYRAFAAAVMVLLLFGIFRISDNFWSFDMKPVFAESISDIEYKLKDQLNEYPDFDSFRNLRNYESQMLASDNNDKPVNKRNTSDKQGSITKPVENSTDNGEIAIAYNNGTENITGSQGTITTIDGHGFNPVNQYDITSDYDTDLSDIIIENEPEYSYTDDNFNTVDLAEMQNESFGSSDKETFNDNSGGDLQNFSDRIGFDNTIYTNSQYGNSPYRMLNFYSNDTEVQLSSFLGTDIASGVGMDSLQNSLISHFSQSLAYALDDRQRIGIEIGYSEYSYEQNIEMKVPLSSAPPPGKNPGTTVESVEIGGFNNGSSGGEFITKPFSYFETKQLFWGAAFYEYSIIRTSDFSLNGRLGAGANSDGPLGFGKLFAKYELFSGFALTIGGEGRVFVSNFTNEVENEGIYNSLSLIYGFQLKF